MDYREATVSEVREYFGMSVSSLRTEWMGLSEEIKTFFKKGVGAVLKLTDTKPVEA